MRFVSLIGVVIGSVLLLAAFFVDSAHQQAALAGMACACALIPYVLFRLHSVAIAHDQLDQILLLMQQSGRHAARQAQEVGASRAPEGPAAPKTWMP